jgi:hypothetical protein
MSTPEKTMSTPEKGAGLSPFVKCETCGSDARFDHLMPHPSEPVDRLVYHCDACGAFTIVDRPRPGIARD